MLNKEYTREELLELIKRLRTIAWITFADGRSHENYERGLYEILKLTKDIGND